ncbi:MAG: Hsp70 family protein [Rickettsiales bacterium]|nr:MAG: Hsp70 family protein [Rickettsiales bacterium]
MIDIAKNNIDEVVGIDLGTRFSCISTWKNKKLDIICDNYGNRTLPSIVSFINSAKLVGTNALALKEVAPENTIYDIKRLIGKKIDDSSISQIKQLISYDIIGNDNKDILVCTNDSKKRLHKPVEICSFILKELKTMADNFFKKSVTKAVITVPAYFNDYQRQATLDAAEIAGFNVLKIINEPTAAAIAYGMGDKQWNKTDGGNIIVYDFGAGTLDVSLINISIIDFEE